jgi:hypothetical protein
MPITLGSGDAPGDASGNASGNDPTPKSGDDRMKESSGKIPSGRFWVLDGVSSDEDKEGFTNAEKILQEGRYVCDSFKTNKNSSFSAKQARRDRKRKMQRWAAKSSPFHPRRAP